MVRNLLMSFIFVVFGLMSGLAQAGPVVLIGIDAEDGNVSGGYHGGTAPYVAVLSTPSIGLLSKVTNGGSGILVVGGGKDVNDDVTRFWEAIGAGTGQTVTYVNGPAAIKTQSFAGFKAIAVVSSGFEAPGGLIDSENDALATRQTDIAAFVNGGGGLFGLTQHNLATPFAYLPNAASFINNEGNYDQITATSEGEAVGITDTNLDTCCWHNTFPEFPSYLQVLATNDANGEAAALGGENVILPAFTLSPSTATNFVNDLHTVTATVTTTADGVSTPVVNNNVDFSVSGPGATTGNCTTDAAGMCGFTYTSAIAGNDTITATTIILGATRTATAQKTWIEPAKADLSVTKTASPNPVLVQDNITYTITVTNYGPDTADNVSVSDVLPASTSFVSATPSQGSCAYASGTVRCAIGAMTDGQVVTIKVVVRANKAGKVTNSATATTTTLDPNGANNTGSSGPVTVNKRPSSIAVDAVIGTRVSLLSLTVNLKPRAVLRDATTNAPLAGKVVEFSANNALLIGTTPLCTATTNARGVATCSADILASTVPGVLAFGYTGAYAGNQTYRASSGKGALLKVVISGP